MWMRLALKHCRATTAQHLSKCQPSLHNRALSSLPRCLSTMTNNMRSSTRDEEWASSNPFKQQQEQQQQSSSSSSNNHDGSKQSFLRKNNKIFFALILAATTITLGVWQTRRYLWKVDLIEHRKKTLFGEPIALSTNDKKAEEEKWLSLENTDEKLLYKKFVLRGHFLNDKTVLIGTRQSPVSKRKQMNTRSAGETGYFVMTPFLCANTGKVIFVNRGWLPKSKATPEQLALHLGSSSGSDSKKLETITAVFREYEEPGYINKDQYRIGDTNVFLVMDPSVIADELRMDHLPQFPLFADQMRSGNDDLDKELPMRAIEDDHLLFYVMPHTHVAYLTVWYGLTAWILGTTYYMRFKKKRW